MKNHFNNAAGGFDYKSTYHKKKNYSLWEDNLCHNDWHKTGKWSSTTTTLHKGFGGIVFDTIIEHYNDEPHVPRINPATARANEIVNKAIAEAIAESAAPARPTFFSRLLGRKP